VVGAPCAAARTERRKAFFIFHRAVEKKGSKTQNFTRLPLGKKLLTTKMAAWVAFNSIVQVI
jgi:hypothetical protein